jgi:hypothetical protein
LDKSRPTTHILRAAAITFAVGAVAALAGCGATPRGTDAATSAVTGFGHIHGLAADASTGNTYAATHNGVWLIPTGVLPDTYLNGAERTVETKPRQIAGRAQDTMAFKIAGPGLLLASGHPDPVEQPDLSPPNLGLISSTDQAQTWTSLSLHGTTDFHDLDAVALKSGELRVYGYDADDGTVKISDDSGLTWSSGAAVQLRDLVADPSNPDRVFATTANGLLVSEDAGRTFAGAADTPTLLLIDAIDEQDGGGFIGIDPGGAGWHRDAVSRLWAKSGQADGAPEALGYVGGSAPWILVADRRGIVASDDYGASWTILVPKEG